MNLSMLKGKSRSPWFCSCLALLVLLTFTMQSCKKEYFELDRVKDPTWNPEVAIPLIASTIDAPDILDRVDEQDIITVLDNGTGRNLLALRYEKTVFSLTAEEWLELPGQSIAGGVPITAQDITDINNNGSKTVNASVPVTFNGPGSETLTEVAFKDGNVDFNFSSAVGYPAVIDISIPALTNGGNSYSAQVNVAAFGTGVESLNLTGYVLDLTMAGQNEFTMDLAITYSAPGSASPLDLMNVDINFYGPNNNNGPNYSLIRGDFGTQNIPVDTGTVSIKLFENELGGTIIWDSAIVRGNFENGFGLPVNINMLSFDATNTDSNITVPIQGFSTVNVPAAPNTNAIGTGGFELLGNSGGANAVTIANLNPDEIFYEADVVANPGGGPNTNFAEDTSKIDLTVEAVLPFHGRALDFSRGDTVDVDIFPLNDDVEEIVSILLRLTIDNGFPADAHAQIVFMDSNFVRLDSVFSQTRQQVFSSPNVPASGEVDPSDRPRTVTDIVLDRELLEKLEAQGMRKIFLRGWVETFNMGNTPVKIFESYSMDLWLGMMIEAKVKIPIND